MSMMRIVRGLGTAAMVAALGCRDLNIENPNEPDARRALSDPSAIEAVAAGAMRTWFNTYEGLVGVGPLVTQAQSYTSSWNNANMNFYSSLDADGTRKTRPWQNDPAAAARTTVEWFWSGGVDQTAGATRPGYYAVLSAASDALRAIRKNGKVVGSAANTKRVESIGLLMQGAALSGIALTYDKGFIVDENVAVEDLLRLSYATRKQIRDAAVAKLTEAMNLAKANTFTTDAAWTNGRAYTNTQIAQIAATMAALTLAYYPRDAAENAQVDWNKVAEFAAQGMSSGTPVDFIFVGDGCTAVCPELLVWFNSMDTGRLHTRVATLLDPATQQHPWPGGDGNAQPNSVDKRLGDGSFGPNDSNFVKGFGTVPKTARGGTDFAWSRQNIFRPDRGSYHQSNIAHIRYDRSGEQSTNDIYGGYGPVPAISAAQNDLIWAEALLRRGTPDFVTAASLINKTRVDRGGLPPATPLDGPGTEVPNRDGGLMNKLLYEKEVELVGLGAAPFFERRRLANGLIEGTPREMPVPAKELSIKNEALYTWGGSGAAKSPTP